MATGRKAWRNRLVLLSVVLIFVLLVMSGLLPNPFPAIWDWLGRERPLAADLAWQERLGGRPGAAAVAGDTVAVTAGSDGVLFDRDSGTPVTPSDADDWRAEWLVVAGAGDDAVLVTSPRWSNGYQLRDPGTGEVRYEDSDALAVWGYADLRLDLLCDSRRACRLRGYPPAGGDPVWSTDLPGSRSGMLGGNPPIAGPQTPEPSRIHPAVAGPQPAPRLLGFPVTLRGDDVVVIVDPRSGRIVREVVEGPDERVIVAGGRVVRATMTRHSDVCVSEVTGYDATTGDRVWGPLPYHLWRTEGFGCEQRTPPLAGGAALAAVGADGQPVVLDAFDGRVLWAGERGEEVAGLSPDRVVIRAEEQNIRYAVGLGGDGEREWERRADPDAGLVIAGCGVVVTDRNPNRVYVWDPATGEDRLSVSTSARVLACGPDGVLIADGRSVGFARFDDAPPPPVSEK